MIQQLRVLDISGESTRMKLWKIKSKPNLHGITAISLKISQGKYLVWEYLSNTDLEEMIR